MTLERWERLNEIFHRALEVPHERIGALLDDACAGDAELRREAERLIDAHARAGRFIEAPARVIPDAWPEPQPVPSGQRFGAYKVVRELGRGGMGAVYLAERADGQYEQRVALKVIKRGMDIDVVLARFRTERQILATLVHPNIARLLDGGTTEDGSPFFVMEYIDGEPIHHYVATRDIDIADRLRLFLQICDAVEYAHQRHVIHRDIKPLNILVTSEGTPKLLDFGIAKVLEPGSDENTTVTAFRMLTPEYASPEQVQGRHVTAASDIYSLGVVLYELLTQRSPYEPASSDRSEIADAVSTTVPKMPSVVASGVVARQLRGDLDTVVMTALRKEPERRYSSVAALIADIRAFLENRSIAARPDAVTYRFRKFVKRNRTALTAAGVAVLATGLTALGVVTMQGKAKGAEPSLLTTGDLAPRDRILVADFTDRSGDPVLATALAETFRADLAQSSVVQVLTSEQVYAALDRIPNARAAPFNDSIAREVALREGAKAIVTGSLARLGNAYTLNLQLVNAEHGHALAAIRETASDSTELIHAVDRASKTLRGRLGESLRFLQSEPSLEKVTTASLPALRSFTTGVRLYNRGERTQAITFFERAVELDSGFAHAHFMAAAAYEALREPGRSREAGNHAMANKERLPFLERKWLIASNAYANGHYAAAIKEYESVLERYPTLVQAMNNMALAYHDSRRFATAEQIWQRSVQLDSSIAELYIGLHSAQLLQGKSDAARSTLKEIASRFPENRWRLVVEVQDAAARREWDAAERFARRNVTIFRDDTLALLDVHGALASILMTRGRLADAEQQWRLQRDLSRVSRSFGREYLSVLQIATARMVYRHGGANARNAIDSLLMTRPLDSLLPADRPYDELARFYARSGDLQQARKFLAAAQRNDAELGRVRTGERAWTRGLLAYVENRTADAQRDLQIAAETHLCSICPLPDLARAYESGGQPDRAVESYHRYLAKPWLWRHEIDAFELWRVMLSVSRLHERRAEPAKAAAMNQELKLLWQSADELVRLLSNSGTRRAE